MAHRVQDDLTLENNLILKLNISYLIFHKFHSSNYLREMFVYIHQKRDITIHFSIWNHWSPLSWNYFLPLTDMTSPPCVSSFLTIPSPSLLLCFFFWSLYSLNIGIPYLSGPSIFICLAEWSHPVPWLYHLHPPNSTWNCQSFTLSK